MADDENFKKLYGKISKDLTEFYSPVLDAIDKGEIDTANPVNFHPECEPVKPLKLRSFHIDQSHIVRLESATERISGGNSWIFMFLGAGISCIIPGYQGVRNYQHKKNQLLNETNESKLEISEIDGMTLELTAPILCFVCFLIAAILYFTTKSRKNKETVGDVLEEIQSNQDDKSKRATE